MKARVLSPADRKEIRWWVDFAYQNLSQLPPKEAYLLEIEVVDKVFGFSQTIVPNQLVPVANRELRARKLGEIQSRLREMLEGLLSAASAEPIIEEAISKGCKHKYDDKPLESVDIDALQFFYTEKYGDEIKVPIAQIPPGEFVLDFLSEHYNKEPEDLPITTDDISGTEFDPYTIPVTYRICVRDNQIVCEPEKEVTGDAVVLYFLNRFAPLPANAFTRCEICGRYVFSLKGGDRHAKYCSKACAWNAWSRTPRGKASQRKRASTKGSKKKVSKKKVKVKKGGQKP